MSKNKKKKKTGKQNHLSEQATIRHQLITSGTYQQQLALPKMAKEYMESLPEEEKKNWEPAGLVEIAEKAGVKDRIGNLLSVFYHIHTVETFLTGEITKLIDGFNLWLKGIRPAMNDIERADDKFFEAMSKLVDPKKNATHEDFIHDVDSLHEKLMHWEGVPRHWKIGDPQRCKLISEREIEDGKLVVDTGHEEILVSTVTLPPEVKGTKKAFCISKLNNDETADIVKSNIKTLPAASTQATILAKKDPGNMYVIYEEEIQTQEVATIRPIKAAQRPRHGKDVVKVEIHEEEGGCQ